MSKLRSVIRHEYLTIVKQPSFWIVMIAIPAMIAFIGLLMFFSNQASVNRIEELAKDMKNVAIVDESGLLNAQVVESAGLSLSPAAQTETLREAVRESEKEALVVFPANLQQTRDYTIYLSSTDITKMRSVSSLADSLLKTSLFLPLGSAEVIALAQNGASNTVVTYNEGRETAGVNEYVIPAIFVILFYIVFAFSVSYMLSSVSEEKENRSMEMVLTYVKPRTLILGKLLAVSLVTLTQIAFFGILTGLVLLVASQAGISLPLPFGIDLSRVVFDVQAIFFGFAFLIVGFLMYAGFMTSTASMAPSTKEANSFSAVFFIGAFVPFYFIMLIVTDPTNSVVTFMSYFPLTSPIVALIRNVFGSMGLVEAFAILGAMTAFMIASLWMAIRAFRLGSLEFSQAVSLSKLFKK